MPIDASIPLQAKRPDVMGRLSELTNMQRQSLAVQADKVALRSAEQSQGQREALAKFDWSKLSGSDGTIDLNKIMDSGLRDAAGDQFPQVLSQAVQIRQQQLGAKQTLIGLTDAQRKTFAEMVGALRSDTDVVKGTPEGQAKLNDSLRQYVTMYGPDVENVVKAYAGPIMNAPPGKLGQVLQNIQLQATSASEQATRQAPQYTNTGGMLQQTNPYAQPGQAPGSIPLTIAPGQQETITTDQAGNPIAIQRTPRGAIAGAQGIPGITQYRPGEVQSETDQALTNRQIIKANRQAADVIGDQLYSINSAMKLADDLKTGGGTDFARKRANFESGIAAFIPGFDTAVDDATKLQLMDKYLERVAAASSQITGAPDATDAARASISHQNASVGYTPDAIKNVLSFAKAQAMAVKGKARAQELWLEDNNATDAHKFESKWRESYDPKIFMLEASSEAKQREMIKNMTSEERAEVKAKLKVLRDLGAL
jgi:hypothetical protein